MLVMFDYKCNACGAIFEELVDRDSPTGPKCQVCFSPSTTRLLSPPHIDGRIGVSRDFPTMADKWDKRRKQHQRIEERRKAEHGL